MSGEGKGIVGVPSSLTDVLPKALEAELVTKRRIFIQGTILYLSLHLISFYSL